MTSKVFMARCWTLLSQRVTSRHLVLRNPEIPRSFFHSLPPRSRIDHPIFASHSTRLHRFVYSPRRYYSANHLPGPPSILPYTFLAICCTGCAFYNYARTTEPRFLKHIHQHAVCSLQNIREKRYYTLLTSSFMHFSPIHLALNMVGLYTLGPLVVSTFGPGAFLTLWVGSSLACDTAVLYWDWLGQQAKQAKFARIWGEGIGKNIRQYRTREEPIVETHSIGASGSVLGLFAAFTCMMPRHKVMIMPIPFPIQAWIGIGGFALGSLYCAVNGLFPFVGHAGHLGGMAFGTAWFAVWGRRVLRRGR